MLKLKYYVRLADDFVILLETKEEYIDVFNNISIFLRDKLKLELNNRSGYFPSRLGVDFCGYRIYETHKIIRKRVKRNIRNKLLKFNKLALEKKLDIKKMDNSLSSYYGHMNYCDSYRLKEKIKYERNEILKKYYNSFINY